MDLETFNRLLQIGFEKGVSDIHFEVNYPPLFRVRGHLVRSKLENLSDKDTEFIVKTILTQHKRKVPEDLTEFDTSYAVSELGRFRVTIFRQKGHLGVVMRTIPLQIRSITELNLPAAVEGIAGVTRGLVLVTGPTGNGKSTTLAAIIRKMTEMYHYHIVTIEDPIEFIFPTGNCCIIQREVGIDTPDYHTAMKSAMRMDPDVILLGELRDQETIDACIKAAETGHLVLSTLHTNDVATTINRVISYFPPQNQEVVRQRLADILMATVSLRLLSTKSGDSLVPAVEIMRSTAAIQACIREGRLGDIRKHIERGKEEAQMQTFDQHLIELCKRNIVSLQEALQASSSSDLERNLMIT